MVPGYIKKENDGRGTHREAACLEVSSGQKHLIGIFVGVRLHALDQDGMWVVIRKRRLSWTNWALNCMY